MRKLSFQAAKFIEQALYKNELHDKLDERLEERFIDDEIFIFTGKLTFITL